MDSTSELIDLLVLLVGPEEACRKVTARVNERIGFRIASIDQLRQLLCA